MSLPFYLIFKWVLIFYLGGTFWVPYLRSFPFTLLFGYLITGVISLLITMAETIRYLLDSHAVKRHLYLELCSEECFLLFCCWQLLLSLMLYSLHLASNGWTRWMDIWTKLRNVCFAFHGLFSCHLSNQKELIKNIVIN